MNETGDLELKADALKRPKISRVRYIHPLQHYAEALGLSGKYPTKYIARMIERGKKSTPWDLPPLDNLEDLGSWWLRNHPDRKKLPDFIAALEVDSKKKSDDATSETCGGETGASQSPPHVPDNSLPALAEINVNGEAASDLGVRLFLGIVQDTIRRINESARAQNHREYNRLLKELAEQLEHLRKQESSALKSMEGKGEFLRARVLNTEVVSLLSVISQNFTVALDAAVQRAAPQLTPEQRRAITIPQRDSIFVHLKSTRFTVAITETTSIAA